MVLRKSHSQPACTDRLSEQAKGNPMKPPKDTTEPPASLWSPLKNTVFNYIPILKSRHRAIDGGGFLTMRGGGGGDLKSHAQGSPHLCARQASLRPHKMSLSAGRAHVLCPRAFSLKFCHHTTIYFG